MNSVDLSKLTSAILVGFTLTACGGGSSDNQQTSNTTNTQSQSEKIECVNGIPKNLKTQGSGFYDEEQFFLDTEYDANSTEKLVISSHQLKDGVWYQSDTNLLKNTIPLTADGFIEYILTPSKLETGFKRTVTSSGIPLGYVLSQNADSAQLAMFTDACSMNKELQMSVHTQRVDLSGKKISELFAYTVNSQGQKEYKYLPNALVNYLIWQNPEIGEKIKNSPLTFPQGARLGFNDREIYTAPILSFYTDNDYGDKSLEEYAKKWELDANQSWKKDVFGGLNVIYAIDKATSQYVYAVDPAVEMNGKIYDTEWMIPGNRLEYDNSYENGIENNDLYFNKIAIQTLADAINAAE
jgi:hypothetical protein